MTREEIVEAIVDDKMMPYINPDLLPRIVDFVIKNYKPSLPSNLDEAAREFAKTTFTRPLSDTPEQELIIIEPDKLAGFKAGAEWMAGQGETAIVKVDVNGMNTPIIYLWDDKWKKYSGDEVVVQIRKK